MAAFGRAILSGMVACVALAASASAQGQMTVTVPAVGCKTLVGICGRSAREIDCYWMSYEAFTASP